MHQSLSDFKRDVHGLAHGQRACGLGAPPDCFAFDELEGNEVEGAVLPDAVHPGDILVIQPGRRSPFLVEPGNDLGIGTLIGRQ